MSDLRATDKTLVEEAKERAERAKRYAELFPNLATPESDFTSEAWQYAQLERYRKMVDARAASSAQS